MNKNILFGFFIILLILFSGISFADLDEYTAPLDSKIDLTKYFNAYYTVLLENSEVQYFGMLKNAKDLTTKTAVNPNNFDITLKQKIQDYKNALSITNVIVDSTKPDLASLEISRIHQTALVDQADIREQLEELYDYVEDINEDCIKDGSFDTDNKKCVLADDDYDDEDFALDGEPTSGYAYSLWGIGIIIVFCTSFYFV